ncbi:MAG: hypothetical protein NUV76_09590 [Candidatus Kuenenia sp.]|nr:hypothetical protein [Candidatus Kuenenia sp.]
MCTWEAIHWQSPLVIISFKTYSGSAPETDNTVYGFNSYVVVTLVDQDLNVSGEEKQSTAEYDDAVGNQLFWNENGLGVPSAPSWENTSKGYMNGGTAKIVYASTLNSLPHASVDLGAFGNTIDFALVETEETSGTFKGSFFLTNEFSFDNANDIPERNGD